VIEPSTPITQVDGLLSGFHDADSSHLSMLEAIAGRKHLRHAYDALLEQKYLWHEFGDVHLILP